MSSLINLLSVGPGTFIFHFLVLLALGAMGGIALIEWRHTANPDHQRVLLAFAGLASLRLPLLLIEPQLNTPEIPTIVAPLLGGIEVASLVVLSWAFLAPLLKQRDRRLYLFGGLGVALLCAITFLPGWYKTLARYPNLIYVAFWQQAFWHVVSLLLTLGPAAFLVQRRRGKKSSLPEIGFTILSVGYISLIIGSLSLTIRQWNVGPYTLIGIGRFIHLLGYPLFTIAVYRTALQDMWSYRQELQAMSGEALRQTQELHFLVKISRVLGDSLNLDAVLRHVVESITMALNADRCAIFLINPDETETIHLAALYAPLQREDQTSEKLTLSLSEQPTLDYVIQRRKQLTLNVETDNPRLQSLYELLGCQKAGPTIVQPLTRQRRALGALVVGNNHNQHAFEPNAGRLCQSIATQISATLENIQLYRDLKSQAHQLAELLQSQEEEVRKRAAILESIAEGVIVSNQEGHITHTNAAAERILGAPRQRILGHTLERLIGDFQLASDVNWKTISQSDIPLQRVLELEGKILHINAAPVRTPAGDQLGAVAVLRDVTKETEAEQAKSGFITAISHELRTPLTAIRGYSEALTSGMAGTVGEAQSHFIDIIRDNALHMTNLTDNLIAIAQIEKGALQLEYKKIDLNEIIREVINAFQSQFEARQLEIEMHLTDDLPLIEADPARAQQVLDNLISNAVKFTPSGGRITVGTNLYNNDDDERATTHCAIWVEDTGVGISPEERAHIWERFYHPTESAAMEARGLGVGLSIVKSLVEAHNGRVWLENIPETGSKFTVILPVIRVQPINR